MNSVTVRTEKTLEGALRFHPVLRLPVTELRPGPRLVIWTVLAPVAYGTAYFRVRSQFENEHFSDPVLLTTEGVAGKSREEKLAEILMEIKRPFYLFGGEGNMDIKENDVLLIECRSEKGEKIVVREAGLTIMEIAKGRA